MFRIHAPWYISLPCYLAVAILSYFVGYKPNIWWRIFRWILIAGSILGMIGFGFKIEAVQDIAIVLLIMVVVVMSGHRAWHAIVYTFSKSFNYRNFDDPL